MALLAVLATAAFAIQSLAWPLFKGRDALTYLMYYLELWQDRPVFPQLMLFRTPGAPIFFGPLLQLGESGWAEVVLGLCYVLAILAVYYVGSFWNRRIGIGVAITLLLNPAYGALYHAVSSDGLFAFGMAVWAAFICATAAAPAAWKLALHGVAVFLLTMIRPSGLFFLAAFIPFPFLLRSTLRQKFRNAVIFAATATVFVMGWAAHNQVRYGDFTISRMNAAFFPLFRLLVIDRVVKPGNGPASRELASAIKADLLRREPYMSYGIDLKTYFETAGIRMWSDLAGLSDRTWGWDSDYQMLRRAALEAILRYPLRYASGVRRATVDMMLGTYAPPPPTRGTSAIDLMCEVYCATDGFVIVNGRKLPRPVPGEPIPIGHAYWLASTPDDRIGTDWSSLARPRLTFKDPQTRKRFEDLIQQLEALVALLPPRDGSLSVASGLNFLTRLSPSMWVWLVIGVMGLIFRPQPRMDLLALLCFLALTIVIGSALGGPPNPLYRLPVDPLFILVGIAGLLGRERVPAALPG